MTPTPVPFVFGHGAWTSRFATRCPLDGAHRVQVLDVLDPSTLPFFHLVLAGNARAFGDMGMPPWVLLDCATLPTAMIGFAQWRDDVDPALFDDLAARVRASAGLDVSTWSGLVPVAEYCALPTPEPGHVVGFSLFSLLPGLGLRAKAMALAMMGARSQTGITQITSTALRAHARLGPLRLVQLGVAAHSKPHTTLVYRLDVPDDDTLAAIARGELLRVPGPAGDAIALDALRPGMRIVDVDHAQRRAFVLADA